MNTYGIEKLGIINAKAVYRNLSQLEADGKIIRIGQASVVSPLWMTYNLIIPVPSIGGVLTESINIASVIISLYRYRKTGFTQR